jgi:GlcNAc-P-P-Und epimerase
MRALVTGGSGFVGARLVTELRARGHDVRILDKVVSAAHPNLCRVGDVRDAGALEAEMKHVDVVYHLAAEHRDDVRPVALYYDVNVEGTKRLTEACAATGVSNIVFTSSAAVYPLAGGTPSEDSAPRPFNDYGRSKLQAEEVLRQWAVGGAARSLVIVRPAVIFGEGNHGNVYNLVRQIAAGRFVMVGKGTNRKSMGYVGNLASFLASCDELKSTGVQLFNYADKPDFSMNELIEVVMTAIGERRRSRIRIPYWLGLAAGKALDAISLATGKRFPISAVRIRKFCSTTSVAVDRLQSTSFVPAVSLRRGMELFLRHEFGRPGVTDTQGASLTDAANEPTRD